MVVLVAVNVTHCPGGPVLGERVRVFVTMTGGACAGGTVGAKVETNKAEARSSKTDTELTLRLRNSKHTRIAPGSADI